MSQKKYRSTNVEINIMIEDAEMLTSALLDYFCKHGLKEDDEPNALGHRIEDLIDKINNGIREAEDYAQNQ